MPFSDGGAMDHLAGSVLASDQLDEASAPRTGQVAPRTTLLADSHNPEESEYFTSLPPGDQKIMRFILWGEYKKPEDAETETTPGDADEQEGGELAARFDEGVEELRRFGALDQSYSRDRLGRNRSALVYLPRKSARTLTIVFNGNPPMLAVPIPLLTRFDTHLILTRDPKRCFGLAGLPGVGADYDECVVTLRKFIDHLGVEAVYCLGVSAGGASAIKFGVDLEAQGVLCFSSPTTLNLDDDPGAELSHYPQLTQLYRTDRSLGIDLADYYRRAARRPGLIMVFGADHPRDSWLAERVGDVQGAELIEVRGLSGHKTYMWATQHGFTSMLLERMFRLSPVDATS